MGDVRTTTGEKLPPTAGERRSRRWRRLLTVGLLLTAVGMAGHLLKLPRYVPASGFVTTSGYAEVRAAVTGRIAAIVATSGAVVQAGDALVRLEDDAERATLAEAHRQVTTGDAELAYREAAVADNARQHANRIRAAELEVAHARERLDVTRQLHAKGLSSGRQLADDAHAVVRGEEALRALQAIDLTVATRQLEVFRSEVAARLEALARAEAALAQRTVRAPRAGRIVRYTFFVGELVRPDMVLYEVFEGPVDTLKLRVPERYAARVRPGMLVEAQFGTHRTLWPTRFPATVDVLRDVVEGDGTRNYRSAYGTLAKAASEVPPGTSVDARIRIGRGSLWSLLLRP